MVGKIMKKIGKLLYKRKEEPHHRHKTANMIVAVISSLSMIGGTGNISTIPIQAAEETNIIPDKLYTWSNDSIDHDYAYGTIDLKDADAVFGKGFERGTKSGMTDKWYGRNTDYDEDHTVLFKKAAFYKDKTYDIKMYLKGNLKDTGYYCHYIKGDNFSYNSSSNDLNLAYHNNNKVISEWHFYESGTNKEVDFKGAMTFTDLDGESEKNWNDGQISGIEGYLFHNGLKKVYATNDTTVKIAKSDMTYKATKRGFGTQTIPAGSLYGTSYSDGNAQNTKQDFWVTFESTIDKPLSFEYFNGAGYGSSIGVTSSYNINYHLVNDSDYKPGSDIKVDKVSQYMDKYEVQPYQEDVPGYTFDGWYLDEGLTQKATNFTNITNNHTVYGKYTQLKYNIDTSGTHVSIDQSISNIPYGSDKTISWKADDGYHITSVIIDNAKQKVDDLKKGNHTFNDIKGNHSVVVVAEANYNIKTSSIHATIDPDITNIEPGTTKTINWQADKGYHISSVLVDGNEEEIKDSKKGSYVFDNIQKNHTVSVVATKNYAISTSSNHTTIDKSITDITPGDNKTINWKADDGYYISKVTIDGNDQKVDSLKNGSYTFGNINEDHTIHVEASPCYKIITKGENATISENISNIMPGDNQTVTWKANDGYYISQITVDGKSVPVEDVLSGKYDFTNIKSDHEIVVKASSKYTITTSAKNATIDPDVNNIAPGDNQTIHWKANDGYFINKVTVDGNDIDVKNNKEGEYAFENIKQDHNVAVEAVPCYQIETEITNGTITPSINQVYPNESKTITYKPNDGYYISEIVIDGQVQDPKNIGESYTFEKVNTNHHIKVVCEPLRTVTTKITNGTITKTMTGIHPDTDTSVLYEPFKDYYIKSVNVDGKDVKVDDFKKGNITFSPTKTDHTVVVVCEAQPTVYTQIDKGNITDTFKVYPHEDGTVVATPSEGRIIDTITVDGKKQNVSDTKKVTLPFKDIVEDHHVVVTTRPNPELAVEKASDKDSYNLNDIAHYTVTVRESALDSYDEDVVVTDTLPEGTELIKDSVKVTGYENAKTSVKGNILTVTLDKITDKAPLLIDYDVKIVSPDSPGKPIVNKVTVTSKHNTGETADKTVDVLKPAFSLTKKADKETYNTGDTVNYTLDAKQTVKDAVGRNIKISDTLPDGVKLNPDSIKVNGLNKDKYKITTKDNSFDIVLTEISDKTPVSITYSGKVDDKTAGQKLENVATLTNPSNDKDKQKAKATINVVKPSFKLTKKADKSVYNAGETINYVVEAKQTVKGATATNIHISDTMPDGIILDKDSVKVQGLNQDNYSITSKNNGFDIVVKEMTDKTPVTVLYTAKTVDSSAGKTLENVAVLENPNNDKDRQEAKASIQVVKPEYTLEKKSDRSDYFKDDTIAYTITAKQTTKDAVGKNVVISDAVPDGVTLNPDSIQVVSGGKYTVKQNGNNIAVTFDTLTDTAVIRFTGQINGKQGTINNVAVLTDSNPDTHVEAKATCAVRQRIQTGVALHNVLTNIVMLCAVGVGLYITLRLRKAKE